MKVSGWYNKGPRIRVTKQEMDYTTFSSVERLVDIAYVPTPKSGHQTDADVFSFRHAGSLHMAFNRGYKYELSLSNGKTSVVDAENNYALVSLPDGVTATAKTYTLDD